MKILLVIGAGSFVGGIGRYLASQLIQERFYSSFPYGTMSVNIIGCFLIGLLFGFAEKASVPQEWRLFLVTGMLGGFTTFSAFSQETFSLLRDGQLAQAFAYAAISVIIGLVATFVGFSLIKLF